MRATVLLVLSLLLIAPASCGSNPRPGTGTRVSPGVGILDYYTVRATDEGRVVTRDLPPEPRPREAITGDDYFQIKLEHLYIGEALGQQVGNVAVISQIEGVVPNTTSCVELDVSDLEFDLNQRERSNIASPACSFKHVVAINPVFSQSHVTFDSAFITPPFRMGVRPVGLRFIIAQLNDYDLARQLLDWSQRQINNLGAYGFSELNQWQSTLVNIGFTVANYILDYASLPEYVFEFETDFVPVEVVGGVTTPQNLFLGGDFVIVGFPRPTANDLVLLGQELGEAVEVDRSGAMVASHRLLFDSGRLYWRDTRMEYRDGPYVVFKVVRQSRYPDELPVTLAKVSREIERGGSREQVGAMARDAVLELQDLRLLNETEGRYLLDLFQWYVDARWLQSMLERELHGEAIDSHELPVPMLSVSAGSGLDLNLVDLLSRARIAMTRLQERIYDNYGRNPGIWQAECIALRSVTQGIADAYNELRPRARVAFEDLQLQRHQLSLRATRTAQEQEQLEELEAAEIRASRLMDELPEELNEPQCPGLRR
ncbi:MAG: hypothetical protein JW797_09560 [Bradymonadales bacterium]|nr:hypothetical protein [Bradymonadales bacterium]